MNCTQARQRISEARDEGLSEVAQAALESHLTECAECRAFEQSVSGLAVAMGDAPEGHADGRAVRAAIARFQAENTAPTRPAFPIGWGVGLGGATLVAAACAVPLLIHPTEKGTSKAFPSAAVTTVAVMASPTPTPSPVATPTPGVPTVTPRFADQLSVPFTPERKPRAVGNSVLTPVHQRPPLPRLVNVMSAPGPLPARPASSPTSPVADDLDFVNGKTAGFAGRWTRLSSDETETLLAEVRRSVNRQDDFVDVPPPEVAALRNPDVTRNALAIYRNELQIVDARLQRRVTLSVKGLSFAELCRKLSEETGISFATTRTVAEDKVTIFCHEKPLRDLMRQITTLFNFTWDRTGEEGNYSYRLKQPLQAALLEEELRNKDRNEALLALNREMDAYNALLGLSPEEAAARAANLPDGPEKDRLKAMGGLGWGPVQMFSQLGADDLTALRDGQRLSFGGEAPDGQARPLGPEIGPTVLRAMPARVMHGDRGFGLTSESKPVAGTTAVAQYPGSVPFVQLFVNKSEEGQFQLVGISGVAVKEEGKGSAAISMSVDLATGISPSARDPKNAEANAAEKDQPEMKKVASIVPEPSCRVDYGPLTDLVAKEAEGQEQITTADVLEAIHKATGQDVIGDFYTRAYSPSEGTVRNAPLFNALSKVADNLHLRWHEEEGWLTFRSASFFNDRLKEVPSKQLARWGESRRRFGYLPLKDLLEITRLSDIQRSSSLLAWGVRSLYGLHDWSLTRGNLGTELHLLGSLTPAAQQAALSPAGVTFAQLTPQDQETFANGLKRHSLSAEALSNATMRVECIVPPRDPEKKDKAATDKASGPTPPGPRELPHLQITFHYSWGTAKDGFYDMTITDNPMSMGKRDKTDSSQSQARPRP